MSGKLVRIAPETMEKLAKTRKGFETPSDCIGRLLSNNPCQKEVKKKKEEDEDEDDEE